MILNITLIKEKKGKKFLPKMAKKFDTLISEFGNGLKGVV